MSSNEEVQVRCELIQKAIKDNDLLKLYKLLEEANEFGQLGEIERIMKNNERISLASQEKSTKTNKKPIAKSATQEEKDTTNEELQKAFKTKDEGIIMQALIKRIRIVPKDTISRTKLGNILIDRGEIEQARCVFQEGLEIKPRDKVTRGKLAFVLIRQKKFQEAENVLKEGLLRDPNNTYFLSQLAFIAKRKRNKEELYNLDCRIIEQEPNDINALLSLFLQAQKEEKVMYATTIQRIINDPKLRVEVERQGIRSLDKIDKITRKYCVKEVEFAQEEEKRKDKISTLRKKMSDGDITSSEANDILASIEDDTSIAATALKAEIYVRVFSNFKGAKKVIQDRSKQEGTTVDEKNILREALAIIERAQKGIPPRELGNIR